MFNTDPNYDDYRAWTPLPIVQRSGDPDSDLKELMMVVVRSLKRSSLPREYRGVEALIQGVRIGLGVGLHCPQSTQEQLLMVLRNPNVIPPEFYYMACSTDATIIETVEYLCNPQYPAPNPYALPESSQ